jgi:hypothetical protein
LASKTSFKGVQSGCLPLLDFGQWWLQNGLLDDQRGLQILALETLKSACCKGGVEPVNF